MIRARMCSAKTVWLGAMITACSMSGTAVAGEDIATATVIAGLPFYDSGNTCAFADDYDERCGRNQPSTASDVVYEFAPLADVTVTVDLCASLYDTKVYIYENQATPDAPYACNDDAGCGTGIQSSLHFVNLVGGNTYYIVVDGRFAACGSYDLAITAEIPSPPCGACPSGGQPEGEPACGDDYVDTYNGGCNTTGFTPVECSTICAKTGTYTLTAAQARDTDWYSITLDAGETLQYCGIGDGFALRLAITDTNCPLPADLRSTTVVSCVVSDVLEATGPGTFYLWAGPALFSGVPCESAYTLFIDAPGVADCRTVATQPTTWGGVKAGYR